MDYSQHPASDAGTVRKRESKLRPPKNYHPRSKGSALTFIKKQTSSLSATFGYKPQFNSGDDQGTSFGGKDPYDTPDVVSSCDSKVYNFHCLADFESHKQIFTEEFT